MNERIRELAKEAGLWRQHYDIGEESPDKLEQFAELIVKECIEVAYEYDAPKMSGPGMIIGNRIEQHFGVEE